MANKADMFSQQHMVYFAILHIDSTAIQLPLELIYQSRKSRSVAFRSTHSHLDCMDFQMHKLTLKKYVCIKEIKNYDHLKMLYFFERISKVTVLSCTDNYGIFASKG